MRPGEEEEILLLTPAEVGRLFRVDPKTVTRWVKAEEQKLRENPDYEPHPILAATRRTIGGHRRFVATEIRKIVEDGNGRKS